MDDFLETQNNKILKETKRPQFEIFITDFEKKLKRSTLLGSDMTSVNNALML